MITQHDFIVLFTRFITATRTGRRCKKNGERVNPATIKNYENTLRILQEYAINHTLHLYELKGNNK